MSVDIASKASSTDEPTIARITIEIDPKDLEQSSDSEPKDEVSVSESGLGTQETESDETSDGAKSSSKAGPSLHVVEKCMKHKNAIECDKNRCLKDAETEEKHHKCLKPTTTTETICGHNECTEQPDNKIIASESESDKDSGKGPIDIEGDTTDSEKDTSSKSTRKRMKKKKPAKFHSQATTSSSGTSNIITSGDSPSSAPSNDSASSEVDNSATSSCVEVDAKYPDHSKWSISEDSLLRGMKEANDGISWAEIGKALNRGKKEVRVRWTVIKDQPQQDSSAEKEPDEINTYIKEKSMKDGDEKKKKKKKPQFDGEASKSQTREARKVSRRLTMETNIGPEVLSGEEASSERGSKAHPSSSSSSSSPSDEPRKTLPSTRYLTNHIYPRLYPPLISPQADEHFTASDCNVLASVHSKYTRGKWLEMQANFYNVTGRLVPLDMIRQRCEQAEEVQQEKGGMNKSEVDQWRQDVELDVRS